MCYFFHFTIFYTISIDVIINVPKIEKRWLNKKIQKYFIIFNKIFLIKCLPIGHRKTTHTVVYKYYNIINFTIIIYVYKNHKINHFLLYFVYFYFFITYSYKYKYTFIYINLNIVYVIFYIIIICLFVCILCFLKLLFSFYYIYIFV